LPFFVITHAYFDCFAFQKNCNLIEPAQSNNLQPPMKASRLSAVLVAGFLLSTPFVRSQIASNIVEQRVNDILAQMSFADKLSYIGGTGFFDVKAIPGVNLPLNPQLFQTDAGRGARHPGQRSLSGGTCARGDLES
jgi:hypothetical protein